MTKSCAPNGAQAHALAWLDERPEGGNVDELAAVMGITVAKAGAVFGRLSVAKKTVSIADKGLRKRHFSLRHAPKVVSEAPAERKRKPAVLRLDPAAPVVNSRTVKPTPCKGFDGSTPYTPTSVPALFASMRFGSYLKGGWTEGVYP